MEDYIYRYHSLLRVAGLTELGFPNKINKELFKIHLSVYNKAYRDALPHRYIVITGLLIAGLMSRGNQRIILLSGPLHLSILKLTSSLITMKTLKDSQNSQIDLSQLSKYKLCRKRNQIFLNEFFNRLRKAEVNNETVDTPGKK